MTSITSSILQGKLEDGRVYAVYGKEGRQTTRKQTPSQVLRPRETSVRNKFQNWITREIFEEEKKKKNKGRDDVMPADGIRDAIKPAYKIPMMGWYRIWNADGRRRIGPN